jgi:hypothetical protein
MIESKHTKHLILLSVTLICVVVSIYLQVLTINLLYMSLVAAFLTILAPLFSALYVYKGKAARFFAILAGIGMVFGLIYAVDLLASFESFKTICSERGPGHELLIMSDSYTCTAESEVNYLVGYPLAVAGNVFLFWPYVLVILVNLGNLLYLPIRLLKRNR